MKNLSRSSGCCAMIVIFLVTTFGASAEEQRSHEVSDLKITILSTMMTQVGVGEWGFAALIEADGDPLLFDTGLRPDTVLRNAEQLGIDLSDVREVVLSHNHGDHTGGLVALRREMARSNEQALSIAHVGRGLFWERPGTGPEWAMGPRKAEFEASGGRFVEHDKAVEIRPGVWLTGPVPRTHAEKNYGIRIDGKLRTGQVVTPDGAVDDNIPESMSLVINTPRGLVVISGCGHAGMINTLEFAAEITGRERIHAAIGGFHLLNASDSELEWTAAKLLDLDLDNFVGAHCTGLEPVYRLRELVNLDRSTAVVGATGATFTLEDGINALSLAR